jgi:hypothetical protein
VAANIAALNKDFTENMRIASLLLIANSIKLPTGHFSPVEQAQDSIIGSDFERLLSMIYGLNQYLI